VSDEERHSVALPSCSIRAAVLLVRRRDHGYCELPGGVLKLGESIEEGLLREVCEETALRISIQSLAGVYENPHTACSSVFRCTEDGPRPPA